MQELQDKLHVNQMRVNGAIREFASIEHVVTIIMLGKQLFSVHLAGTEEKVAMKEHK